MTENVKPDAYWVGFLKGAIDSDINAMEQALIELRAGKLEVVQAFLEVGLKNARGTLTVLKGRHHDRYEIVTEVQAWSDRK